MKISLCCVLVVSTVLASPALSQKAADAPRPPGSYSGACPQGQTTLCIPLDASFSVPTMDATGGSGEADPNDPCQRNDDDSTLGIPLQFTFDFYGDTYNSVFINNNGNVSFGGPFSTFNPSGFPVSGFPMVAPFWGDVDTRGPGGGVVYYRSEPNRFTVIWDHVGYYNSHDDKLSTFELIITDGTDPLVGIGNNVCFCYDDMSWTTGDASSGVGGFGGIPATAGANKGDGAGFFQVGLFDHPGADYDGPGGMNDGVDFLDGLTICFDTSTDVDNIPPTVSASPAGNTVSVSIGATTTFDVAFISPELDQTTTITVNAGSLNGFSAILTAGNPAIADCTVVADPSQVGSHVVTFTGTDDHPTDPLSTVYQMTVVITTPTVSVDNGCPGGGAALQMDLQGTLQPLALTELFMTSASSFAVGSLLVGAQSANLIRKGCPLIFLPTVMVPIQMAGDGSFYGANRWPAGLPVGLAIHMQSYVIDATSPTGFYTSNTLVITTP